MDTFLENAQSIFDVARSEGGDAPAQDFALIVRPDGSLHFIMESPLTLEAASIYAGARSAYRVTRSNRGVRVEGKTFGRDCVIEQRSARTELFRDQALYLITSPC